MPRPPIGPVVAATILRLGEEGYSERKVARMVCVSRATVRRVWGRLPKNESLLAPHESHAPPGTLCPACGAPLAIKPCRRCYPPVADLEVERQASTAAARQHNRGYADQHATAAPRQLQLPLVAHPRRSQRHGAARPRRRSP